jgi:hypothetical protein
MPRKLIKKSARTSLSTQIWKQIRAPFRFPTGTCAQHIWEIVEYGVAGCRRCGDLHVCQFLGKVQCDAEQIENQCVCLVTGCVLKENEFRVDPFIDSGVVYESPISGDPVHTTTTRRSRGKHDAAHALGCTTSAANSRGVSPLLIHTICNKLLCSEYTTQSYEKELRKLQSRIRWSFLRHIKERKLHFPRECVNMILLISKIGEDIAGFRTVPSCDTSAHRAQLLETVVEYIARFTALTRNCYPISMLHDLKPETLIIGTLYLLRVGLVHLNITLLPRIPMLRFFLPTENQLHTFGFKSKTITEVENVCKSYLRSVRSAECLARLGYGRTVSS